MNGWGCGGAVPTCGPGGRLYRRSWHSKAETDTALLRETVAALQTEQEFFIQRAIGWALREYAKTDAAWVQALVRELGLSGLARREAPKHVGEG